MIHRTGVGKTAGKPKNIFLRLLSSVRRSLAGCVLTFANTRAYPWILGGTLAVVLSFLLTTDLSAPRVSFEVGDVAPRDIKTPQDMRVVDPIATNAKRQAAREKVLPRYDIDTQLSQVVITRLNGAFESIQRTIDKDLEKVKAQQLSIRSKQKSRSLFSESEAYQELYATPAFIKAESAFHKLVGGIVPKKLSNWLRDERFANWIQEDIAKLLKVAYSHQIVSDKRLYASHAAKGITARDIRTGNRVSVSPSMNPLELRQVDKLLKRETRKMSPRIPRRVRGLLISQVLKMVQPTLTFNNRATLESREKAAAVVPPVSEVLKQGEMIVREGERLSEGQIVKLKSLEKIYRQSHVLGNFTGTALVIFILLILAWICVQKYDMSFLSSQKNVTLFVILLLTQVVLLKTGILFSEVLHETFRGIPLHSFYYVIPFCSASLLAAVLQGRSSAVLMAVFSAVLTGLILPNHINFSLVALAGGVLAAIRWKEYRRRTSVLIVALILGLLGAALAMGFNVQEGFNAAVTQWTDVPIALLGGLSNVIIVAGAMPLLESIFKLTTDMRLLELADQNHPLLRKMVVSAPGTYHHSLLVGNLAEEASEAIGSNPLLTRVGAYFHDIGKMMKPEYFIENQGRENRHDRLKPNMSALILISHVKEGVELARSHQLPKEIIDLIQQHHGTSLIRYFYEKAKEQNGNDVTEEFFRYPGPKPQTREAGILMLADMVEASSHSLSDHSLGRLSALVDRIVQSAFVEGQLDNCSLTFRDLSNIQEAFMRVLVGIHHHRIHYPGQEDAPKKGASNGSPHKKRAKTIRTGSQSVEATFGGHSESPPVRR
ncbi:MAG: HDIG domain-containing protein [Nitrospinae bacterium]|nr:HDIG domain-containing protein [Nitrospinota bacterium]